MIFANSFKMIQCNVCNFEVDESDWDTHIDTLAHKKGALLQIMKDRIGNNDNDGDNDAGNDADNDADNDAGNDNGLSDTRDETAEFLEELKQDFINGRFD